MYLFSSLTGSYTKYIVSLAALNSVGNSTAVVNDYTTAEGGKLATTAFKLLNALSNSELRGSSINITE